jgi:hypothetical protein
VAEKFSAVSKSALFLRGIKIFPSKNFQWGKINKESRKAGIVFLWFLPSLFNLVPRLHEAEFGNYTRRPNL